MIQVNDFFFNFYFHNWFLQYFFIQLKLFIDNVKALYRRGKAHIGAWNEREAIADLTKAAELDKSLQTVVNKELQAFSLAMKERDKLQSKKFANMFTN